MQDNQIKFVQTTKLTALQTLNNAMLLSIHSLKQCNLIPNILRGDHRSQYNINFGTHRMRLTILQQKEKGKTYIKYNKRKPVTK